MKHLKSIGFLFFVSILVIQCKEPEDNPVADDTTTEQTINSDMWKAFSDLTVYEDGDFIIVETNGVPDHKSPYFETNDGRYEEYNGNNPDFRLNPNDIIEQQLTFKIPKNPKESTNKAATGLGPMGVAVNGVPLFNQYAGPNEPLTSEINSFDQYNGHPQQQGQYHYHIEPLYLTALNGKESLIGVLLDGFPVYGPSENGSIITNADLDQYHGHFGETKEFPDGIYHYHVTTEDPYINGDGYFGTAGSVTR